MVRTSPSANELRKTDPPTSVNDPCFDSLLKKILQNPFDTSVSKDFSQLGGISMNFGAILDVFRRAIAREFYAEKLAWATEVDSPLLSRRF